MMFSLLRDMRLPDLFKLVMGKDLDKWPVEARLVIAACDGDVRRLKEMAKSMDKDGKGIEVTLVNTNFVGTNVFHAACNSGNIPVLQYLVEELNMDINKVDNVVGFTPLVHATSNGKLPAVRFLLDHGADLHQRHEKVTPLLAAIGEPNEHITKFTPLEMALHSSSVPCVKLLVQAGADLNASRSLSPLAKAAEKGLTEAIKCLVEAGANANVPDTYGRLPIELAAEYGTWEDVEILFSVTSAIPTVSDWSVHGIISHVYMEVLEREDNDSVKKKKSDLKRQAGDAFRKLEYLNASVVYTQALKVDHFDGTLFSNRSLCWLRLGEGEKALDDALKCVQLCPKWGKAYYRKGVALMLLQDYESAYNTLSRGLELDPESEEMEKMFWEAMDLKEADAKSASS